MGLCDIWVLGNRCWEVASYLWTELLWLWLRVPSLGNVPALSVMLLRPSPYFQGFNMKILIIIFV